jgi:hypothetical protein
MTDQYIYLQIPSIKTKLKILLNTFLELLPEQAMCHDIVNYDHDHEFLNNKWYDKYQFMLQYEHDK